MSFGPFQLDGTALPRYTNRMSTAAQPAYDLTATYAENFERGPRFVSTPEPPKVSLKWLLGQPVGSRFGIAAGLLLNSKWVRAYAERGFDILTYKTVRSRKRECYPPPNWVFVEADEGEGPVYVTDQISGNPADASSAVCFGMPSMPPEFWREDVAHCKEHLSGRKMLVVSVVASPEPGWSQAQFADDFSQCAAWAVEAGADVIEANFSCPNVCSAEGQVYLDPALSGEVARTIRGAIGEVPLLLKVAAFPDTGCMRDFLGAVNGAASGVALVNGIARPVLHRDGRPAFGDDFVKAGVLGRIIHRPSVEYVREARAMVNERNLELSIFAVGGASQAEDMADFYEAGADAVMMGSAPMYLPNLACEIKASHPEW
ncbi:MAG: hypothetical protein CMO78_02915 [Verrucomicrobiales bacterium]|nr:hypothetical protein [Verrucomicrobiales bacterium]MBL69883.1 hypothetical protein [Verrucomicrobiales bacterium]